MYNKSGWLFLSLSVDETQETSHIANHFPAKIACEGTLTKVVRIQGVPK